MPVLFRLLPFVMSFAIATSVVAQNHSQHDANPQSTTDSVGAVDFHVDCDRSVRAQFDRGLGLMHHMMYVQARAAFEDITQSAPNCAMAYWGVATTLFQPLWSTVPSAEEIERGRQAVSQASRLVNDKRERKLIQATAKFFEPDTDSVQVRLAAWAEHMTVAREAFPGDPDVAALYALSRLALALEADNRDALHDEAEAVLRSVWEEEPRHPGAVHYTIHATDADGRANNALGIVESYGRIAPNVAHALHMPSHIYVRLGKWPEVIDWNTKSAEAAIDHKDEGATSFHYIHALDYLVYGHLQRGEDKVAQQLWQSARANGPHQGNFPGAFHLASIPARLAVETRNWEAAAAVIPRKPDYIDWDAFYWPEAISWFARGLGAVHTGNLDTAYKAEQRLTALHESAKSSGDPRFATYIETDRLILAGWISAAENKPELAIEQMQAAGELQASTEKHPVTPGALLPPHESLGDLLLALGRPEEALTAYEQSERTWPQRYNTLAGAARAARAAGDEQAADEWSRQLSLVAPNNVRAEQRP